MRTALDNTDSISAGIGGVCFEVPSSDSGRRACAASRLLPLLEGVVRRGANADATVVLSLGIPMWVWIAIGLGSALGMSVVVAFALARIHGVIGRQLSEFYETEYWATLPPARGLREKWGAAAR
jgi:hypothetical protein